MGKNGEEDQHLPTSSGESDLLEANVGSRCCRCRCFGKIFGLKCLFVLFLSVAVFLSAIFWLPPFLHDADQGDPDLNPQYRGGVSEFFFLYAQFFYGVAAFAIRKDLEISLL